MPRRFYDSLAELKRSVLSALSLLGAKEVYSQLGGTYIGASQKMLDFEDASPESL
jgi:hypothetical protein